MLTTKEVAEQLRVNVLTVQRWLREGRLRGVMIGGRRAGWRIPESEIRQLLQQPPSSRVSSPDTTR